MKLALIGYGYWGPNLLRNLAKIPSATVVTVCDLNPAVLTDIPRLYPTVHTTTSVAEIMKNPEITAVVIATPPSTHFILTREALQNGKHVLVEKPFTQSATDAKKLIRLATSKKLTLMVDHTFLYTPAVRELKKIVASGLLGRIITVDSVRTNLGLFQKDNNVISDLAIHDFAIMDYLFAHAPTSVSATGIVDSSIKQETVAYVSARYKNGMFLHTHVSWLSPVKIRRMMIVGTKKMLMYDDIEPSEKIKIYDKSVSVDRDPKNAYSLRVGYRSGAIRIPHIAIEEGLAGVVREFVRSCRGGKHPQSDGYQGLRVVRAIEAATKSIRSGGKTVKIL